MLLHKIAPKTLSFVTLSLMAALLGCDYNKATEGLYRQYLAGDYVGAANQATKVADGAPNRDVVVLRLEEGSLQHAATQFVPSNKAFEQANGLISRYDEQPEFRVSQESIALAVNQATLDYRGYEYDKIMLNTYQALNYLQLGNLDAARVQLRRAYQRQQEAVNKYAKEIEANNQTRAQNRGTINVEQTSRQNDLQSKLESGDNAETNDPSLPDLGAYSDYVNPFTEYLRGLFMTYAGVDSSDLEQGATSMRRSAGMLTNNAYVREDADIANKIANGGHVDPTTYVIYEAGVAPIRTEFRIDIPIPYNTRDRLGVTFISVAFPILKPVPCAVPRAVVDAGGKSYETAVVCSMDRVVTQEFENNVPIIITQTLISAALKAAAQYAASRVQGDAGIIANIATSVYTIATNEADLRTWKSLPKLFSVARFPTPPDRRVHVYIPGGASMDVPLIDGVVNVIYIKCPDRMAPPIVGQFKLK